VFNTNFHSISVNIVALKKYIKSWNFLFIKTNFGWL